MLEYRLFHRLVRKGESYEADICPFCGSPLWWGSCSYHGDVPEEVVTEIADHDFHQKMRVISDYTEICNDLLEKVWSEMAEE